MSPSYGCFCGRLSQRGWRFVLTAKIVTQDSLVQKVPSACLTAYAKACGVAPNLIDTESDPILFASQPILLAIYWSKRLCYFGEKRAFLPLDPLDGSGALSINDVSALERGCVKLLHQFATCGTRRSCFVIDAAKVSEQQSFSVVRCLFYQLNM